MPKIAERITKLLFPPILYKKSIYRNIGIRVSLEFRKFSTGKSVQELFVDALKIEIAGNHKIGEQFPVAKVREHYVYEPMRDTLEHPDVYITQIRYYRVYEFLKRNYPDIFDPAVTAVDVGDTDAILLEALGKKGTSVNINKECIEAISKKGITAIMGSAEALSIEDKSFDYAFCFQTLEHCPNPIRVLNELGRVAKKKVFLSIPYTEHTVIYNINYWLDFVKKSWKEENVRTVDCHVFEFSTEDFKNILSYASLEYENSFRLCYFDEDTRKGRQLNRIFPSYFNFFILDPKSNGS